MFHTPRIPRPKLTRGADGKYYGTHRGQEFQVWKKENLNVSYGQAKVVWIARSKEYDGIADRKGQATRDCAVRKLCELIDKANVHVPEIDQLLARWASEIEVLVPHLRERDEQVWGKLLNLRSTLRWLDSSARTHAVQFEEDLAELKAHVEQKRLA